MDNFYARSVFFVNDAEESLAFYTKILGFQVDWREPSEGRVWVFQVSLFGFELILNQVEDWNRDRAGHGRVFIGLEEDQAAALCQHIRERPVDAKRHDWGRPTLVIHDPDENELFFWLPRNEWAALPEPPRLRP